MKKTNHIASDAAIEKTAAALKKNGMDVVIAENGVEAKQKVLDFIPVGSEVMTMSSATLDTIGVAAEINKPNGSYQSVRNKLMSLDRKTQGVEMNKLGATPQFSVGSVHAVTENGQVFIASMSGSQLPAYVYGAQKVIWVIGAQKIVKDMDAALKRIYDYVLPLESVRVQKVFGLPQSDVSKLLIVNREVFPGRITVILVKEELGF